MHAKVCGPTTDTVASSAMSTTADLLPTFILLLRTGSVSGGDLQSGLRVAT
jgi:hypothetical protein